MARLKKVYSSIDQRTNRHQTRGGGSPARKNSVHRYPTRDLKDTAPGMSPTYLASIKARKLKV